MGRVCPAPCETGCNRNAVDDFVGINAVEHYVGDWAIAEQVRISMPPNSPPARRSPSSAAVRPACPPPTNCAARATAVTVFDGYPELGGMMRYGIPGYRMPRDMLDAEISRIIDIGVAGSRDRRERGRETRERKQFDLPSWFGRRRAQSGRRCRSRRRCAELHHRCRFPARPSTKAVCGSSPSAWS